MAEILIFLAILGFVGLVFGGLKAARRALQVGIVLVIALFAVITAVVLYQQHTEKPQADLPIDYNSCVEDGHIVNHPCVTTPKPSPMVPVVDNLPVITRHDTSYYGQQMPLPTPELRVVRHYSEAEIADKLASAMGKMKAFGGDQDDAPLRWDTDKTEWVVVQ